VPEDTSSFVGNVHPIKTTYNILSNKKIHNSLLRNTTIKINARTEYCLNSTDLSNDSVHYCNSFCIRSAVKQPISLFDWKARGIFFRFQTIQTKRRMCREIAKKRIFKLSTRPIFTKLRISFFFFFNFK